MPEFSTPGLVDVDPATSISTLLAERVARDPLGSLAERRSPVGGGWTAVSARAFADEVTAVAKGLVASGVDPGDRVASCPAPGTSGPRRLRGLGRRGGRGAGLRDVVGRPGALDPVRLRRAAVVVETPAHAALVAGVRGDLPHLTDVWTLDDDALAALVSAGAGVDDAEVARRTALAGTSDLATIIYTSGTTGRPKGVELTHGNFVDLALNGAIAFHDVCATPGSRTLLFMPLAHVFARFIQVLCIPSGATMGHTPDPKHLLPDLASFRPTFILAVPRVFEKVYNSAEQKAARRRRAGGSSAGPHRRPSRTRARVETAAAPAPRCAPSTHWPTGSCYGELRAALGGRAQCAISGGAPLGERLGHFYRGLGLQRPRGLRPDRDHGADGREPSRRAEDRHGRPAVPRHERCGSTTTARSSSRARTCSAGTGQRRGDRRGARRRLVPHRRPRRDGRRTASCGSPGGPRRSSSPPAARTWPRPCWRTGCAGTRW